MTDFNVIHKDTPSAMLSDCIRQFVKGGCDMGRDDLISRNRYVRCEVDGEPMGRVVWASIEMDQDGEACLMLFRDTTLAAHVACGSGVRLPLAVAVTGGRHE